jgi:ABC-type phosphate/phosphonate transport system ATPase subunit
VLITGDSGSGKSVLLQEISSQISARGKKEFPNGVISNSSAQVDGNQVLEGVGKDVGEAISILSMAGLNEAFLIGHSKHSDTFRSFFECTIRLQRSIC